MFGHFGGTSVTPKLVQIQEPKSHFEQILAACVEFKSAQTYDDSLNKLIYLWPASF